MTRQMIQLAYFFLLLHPLMFVVQSMNLMAQIKGQKDGQTYCGPAFTNCFSRMITITHVVNLLLVLAYHGGIIVVFKKLSLFPEAVRYCSAEKQVLFMYDKTSKYEEFQQFGDLKIFLKLEGLIFFAQLLSLVFWTVRWYCSGKKYFKIGETTNGGAQEYAITLEHLYD